MLHDGLYRKDGRCDEGSPSCDHVLLCFKAWIQSFARSPNHRLPSLVPWLATNLTACSSIKKPFLASVPCTWSLFRVSSSSAYSAPGLNFHSMLVTGVGSSSQLGSCQIEWTETILEVIPVA
jgi:hypothetical protein